MDREAYLREQMEAYPEDPFWPHTLGVWLMGQGRLTEAEAAFQEALRRSPTHAATYYQMGLLYEMQGQTDKALSAFREGEKLAADQRDLRLLKDFRAKLSLYLGIDEP
jgi:tetratricopeptide (TPR) repeat protein